MKQKQLKNEAELPKVGDFFLHNYYGIKRVSTIKEIKPSQLYIDENGNSYIPRRMKIFSPDIQKVYNMVDYIKIASHRPFFTMKNGEVVVAFGCKSFNLAFLNTMLSALRQYSTSMLVIKETCITRSMIDRLILAAKKYKTIINKQTDKNENLKKSSKPIQKKKATKRGSSVLNTWAKGI